MKSFEKLAGAVFFTPYKTDFCCRSTVHVRVRVHVHVYSQSSVFV